MSFVHEAISTWETYRAGVIAELENVPEEHWDYRPAPGSRTLRELALHIAAAGVGFTAELLRPDGAFLRLFDPQVQAENMAAYPKAHSKEEVIALLRTTGADGARRLRETGDALAEQTMQTQAGQESRLKGLWFAASHEMYHRGQLAVYARSLGLVPALTRQLEAMLAGRRP